MRDYNNLMEAAELQARLENLSLCGQEEDGTLQWLGERKHWQQVDRRAEELLEEFHNPIPF